MRITPAVLHKIARDTVAQRSRSDRNMLAAYLHGSMLEEDPLLGGTTDIDLVFIHNNGAVIPREIKPLSEAIHLDIAHHESNAYRRRRELRLHPWMGPTIYHCRILYDPQHFMDFTQASVRGQFTRPENVLKRARGQAEHARQMWFELHDFRAEPGIQEIELYLRAIEHITNAVASLNGPPLTERRFLMRFPGRAEAVARPGLYAGLLGLLGAPNVDAETLRSWLPAWQGAYQALPVEQAPPRLHACRLLYYRQAFEKLLAGEQPHSVLWPLLRTWTSLVAHLPEGGEQGRVWGEALARLELLGTGFPYRVAALDAFLDTVEETLEEWARANGAEYPTR